MKIVFMGTPAFSVPILEAVHQKYGVSLVVTQPDKFVGRKKVLTYSPVKEKALELKIPVFQPPKIMTDYQPILELSPTLIITAAYGQMIPNVLLSYPKDGAINVHASWLPLLRGGAPIHRAVQRLHNTIGITIMYMAEKMDSGDIIKQTSIPILPNDTSGSLFEKLSIVGRDLLLDTLPRIIDGTAPRKKQNEFLATYAYNIKREEEKINWHLSVEEIDAHVRAFTPSPTCYTTLDGLNLKILNVEIFKCDSFIEKHQDQENGTIVKLFENAIGVKCVNGIIKITKVQLAGKTAQAVKTFMNGVGRNLIKVDKVFK